MTAVVVALCLLMAVAAVAPVMDAIRAPTLRAVAVERRQRWEAAHPARPATEDIGDDD